MGLTLLFHYRVICAVVKEGNKVSTRPFRNHNIPTVISEARTPG